MDIGIHEDCYTGLSEVTQFSWISMPRNLNAYPGRIKSLHFSACEWLCNRHPVTWNTPLEVEISMLRTELEDRSQDVRDRLCSSDSGYVSVRDEEDLDPLEQHPRIKLHGLGNISSTLQLGSFNSTSSTALQCTALNKSMWYLCKKKLFLSLSFFSFFFHSSSPFYNRN